MLSGIVLPAHPYPIDGELFSSWFIRLAQANVSKVHSLAVEILGKEAGANFWNRDIDSFISAVGIHHLSRRTGIPESLIFQTTMRSYEGILFEKINAGFTRWLLPAGVYHRTRKRNWIVFCPLCLKEDCTPYYRKSWRLSFYTLCPVHKIYMQDQCPKCGSPVVFFRQELGQKSNYLPKSITHCFHCDFDLVNAPAIFASRSNQQVNYHLEKMITSHEQGWWFFERNSEVLSYSWLYFDVIHYLCSFLNSRVGDLILGEIKKKINVDIQQNYAQKIFELRSLKDRYFLISAVLWLLDEWPQRMVEICHNHNITVSRITRSEILPYWFHSELNKHLSGIDVIARCSFATRDWP